VLATNRPTVQRNASLIYPTGRPLTPPAALPLAEIRAVAQAAGRFPPAKPVTAAAGGPGPGHRGG
jgi:hypothetical protein